MRDRLLHAARFAITALAAIYLVGLAWEAGEDWLVIGGDGAGRIFRANEPTWRALALGLGAAVFLLRIGDTRTTPPTWPFAWASALWLALATVVVTTLVEAEQIEFAVGAAIAATIAWFVLHRRIPGWPGADTPAVAEVAPRATSAAERELR